MTPPASHALAAVEGVHICLTGISFQAKIHLLVVTLLQPQDVYFEKRVEADPIYFSAAVAGRQAMQPFAGQAGKTLSAILQRMVFLATIEKACL